MTALEKLKMEHPEEIVGEYPQICPSAYGYLPDSPDCGMPGECEECWNREIPEDKDMKPRILDSGHRREFESGAVRDICEGKGRCDLLPLDVVANYLYDGPYYDNDRTDPVLWEISMFQTDGSTGYLYPVLYHFEHIRGWDRHTLILEVSKHFEEGCKKYGDNNWQKGIPVRCYIDSAVRHYLKYLRGDKDEPHDRAFCWNILCCIWTCKHKPELNDYARKETE